MADDKSIFGTTSSVGDIIGSYAQSLELPLDDPKTIDRIIEILSYDARWSKDGKDNLRKVLSKKTYRGDNPELMLEFYDILGGKSKKALAYGFQGFELLRRDPKRIIQLKNPEGLVSYVINSAESLDELVKLKDTLLAEGNFYSMDDPNTFYFNRTPRFPEERLIKSVLSVANEIASQLTDIDVRDENVVSKYKGAEFDKFYRKWRIRLEAHEAIVLAYQAKGKKHANKEALEALAAYDSLAGTYEARGFKLELIEAYARTKYKPSMPSTGEVPDNLKADPEAMGRARFWGRFDWDQYFRQQWFGVKEPEREKKERQKKKVAEFIEQLPTNPWEAYNDELRLLGLTEKMSYEQARSIFREGLKARRSTFIRQDTGTPAYESAMKETAAFIDSWNKVEILYRMNAQGPAS